MIYAYTYNKIRNVIQANIIQPNKKRGESVTCDNIDKPGGYFAELSRLYTERQIRHDLTYMGNLKRKNIIESRK